LPNGLPHLGHFSEDTRNPGLSGTSVWQAEQMPAIFADLEPILASSLIVLELWSYVFTALTGFCPFLCISRFSS
jgi:hypothetical protein